MSAIERNMNGFGLDWIFVALFQSVEYNRKCNTLLVGILTHIHTQIAVHTLKILFIGSITIDTYTHTLITPLATVPQNFTFSTQCVHIFLI